jgi:hypothetical protein
MWLIHRRYRNHSERFMACFLTTTEGAPYLARFWPDVGVTDAGARVPVAPENLRIVCPPRVRLFPI